jgi:hypothetical protein
MGPVAKILLLALGGAGSFGIGWGGAWLNAGSASTRSEGVGPGPWKTSKGAGEASAGLVQRAVIARQGLWALPQSEVVYFRAMTDDQGEPLTNRCVYEIARDRDPPTRWWSVTLYQDNFWVDNPADRYSWTSTNVAREPDGGYRIILAAREQPGNWLPMGTKDGGFSMSFRNYQPEPSIAAAPESAPLPSVRKLSCD